MLVQQRTPPEQTRVLVVEDEPRLRDALHTGVRQAGFLAGTAASGEEALEAMESEAFDILLLDLNLPRISGMEVFRRVHERWPATQVIILTGYGDLEAAKQAIRLGVVEFLTKPASLGEIEQALHRAWQQTAASAMSEPFKGDLDELDLDDDEGGLSSRTLQEIERSHILAALERHQGNREAAANELGISVRTLYYRLAEYRTQ